MYTLHKTCRACGYGPLQTAPGTKTNPGLERLVPVFNLGVQPLANDFTRDDGEHAGFAPLEVVLCPRCHLSQLSVVVNPEVLYSRYLYTTSKSNMMQEHFNRLWNDCRQFVDGPSVIEIGSNDGEFLKFCQEHGAAAVCGIEPADNLAEISRQKGINTINDYFGPQSASLASDSIPEPGIIFARHVFCHVDDWNGFMSNLQLLASANTVICIEVPYVLDQLEQTSFDQIYHEHLSYLSIGAMQMLLNSGPFGLKSVIHYPIHGGAIVLVIQRRVTGFVQDATVQELISRELHLEKQWELFSIRAAKLITDLREKIMELTNQNKRVVGFGASAKSTVWINAMKLNRYHLKAVYDCTPEKLYRYIPGTDIPVVHQGTFYADGPDYAVMFAWNYAAEILSTQKRWMEGGGKFIIPVPEIRIIGLDGQTS